MSELRKQCVQGFQAAIKSVQPYQRVRDVLRLTNNCIQVGQRNYHLNNNVHLAAFGKAALGMVMGAEDALNGHIIEGIASVPRGTLQKVGSLNICTKILEGATNNLPDEDACNNAQLIEEMAKRLHSSNDIFLVLISGGGSALLTAPVSSITVEDKRKTIEAMASHGADIKQLNIVRKALSRLKGGKLARIAYPAKIISIIMSDVVGDPLEFIASGPTVISPPDKPDPTLILKELGVWDAVPVIVQNAVQVFQKSGLTQNVDEDVDVQNIVVANNKLALYAVGETFKRNGYQYYVVSDTIAKDADLYGSQLAHMIHSTMAGKSFAMALQSASITTATTVPPVGNKVAFLFGGECTVTMKGNGIGGRNQHIVLSALSKLLEIQEFGKGEVEFALMSVGTDGQDGPTDAAGAVLTSEDLRFIQNSGLQWQKSVIDSYLINNDSYNFWKKFNNGQSHIVCGPSGTNVMDLQMLLFIKK